MSDANYEFLLIQWQLGKLTEIQINTAVTKEYITQAQANTILAVAQN